ncbi:hypothetical protein [Bacterioplanoides sp.]|uniref:hypothetical protein n=1 Tax=Bacterioplanoides sp. TaxID=2066072 RepID=UPI003B00DECA
MSNKKQAPAEQRQQELEEDIKRFLKHGGKIEKIKSGLTGEKHTWLTGKVTDRPSTVVKLPNHIAPGLTI